MLWLILLISTSTPRTAIAVSFTTRPRGDLDDVFTPRIGWSWLGGDSSASVRVDDTHLWLFGDTLLGGLTRDAGGRVFRNITSMPHSTLAVMHNTTGPPLFLDPPSSRGWFYPQPGSAPAAAYYWIIDGIQSGDTLFIVAMVIENTKGGGFVQLGSDLIVIPYISEQFEKMNPAKWEWNSTRIPFSGGNCSWNEGLALEGD